MNKIVFALVVSLAVVSAQDMCQLYLFSALPALQPLYTSYKEQNWVKLESQIENLVPTAQLISENCFGKAIFSSSVSKNCLKDIFGLARLIAPVAQQANNSEALVNLVNNFYPTLKSAYMTCYTDIAFASNEDVEYADIEEISFAQDDLDALEDLSIKIDIFGCINDVAGIVPLFTQFIKDVKDKKGFEVVTGDLRQILSNVNRICDDCGIPKPSGKKGPVDVQQCLLDAEGLAQDAYAVVQAVKAKSIGSIFSGIKQFFSDLPKTLSDCGLIA